MFGSRRIEQMYRQHEKQEVVGGSDLIEQCEFFMVSEERDHWKPPIGSRYISPGYVVQSCLVLI